MTYYSDIFFDLDRTLWDFDRNSAETLNELYESYGLKNELEIENFVFIQSFREVNAREWRDFRKGIKTKEELRENRFIKTFLKYGSNDLEKARKLSFEYTEICPHKTHLVDGAQDLLESLFDKCNMHIITNGFSEIQHIKIDSSEIRKYFKQIIISDDTPYRKPQREIFYEGIKRAKTSFKNSVMIGDDWNNDIQGAYRAGMDQVFFNPQNKAVIEKGSSTYEIKKLIEIEKIITP